MIFKVGDKPGIGGYKCKSCGRFIKINNKENALKPCRSCGNSEFTRKFYFNLSPIGKKEKLDEILTVMGISLFLYEALEIKAFKNVIATQLRLLLCDTYYDKKDDSVKDISVIPLIYNDFKFPPIKKDFVFTENEEIKFIPKQHLFDCTQNPISISNWLEQEILIDKKHEKPMTIKTLIKYSANKKGGAHLDTKIESDVMVTDVLTDIYFDKICKYILSELEYNYEKDIKGKLIEGIYDLQNIKTNNK